MAADIEEPSESSERVDTTATGQQGRRTRLSSLIFGAIRRERGAIATAVLYGLAIVGGSQLAADSMLYAILLVVVLCAVHSVVAKITRREKPATTSQLLTFTLTFALFVAIVFGVFVLTSG